MDLVLHTSLQHLSIILFLLLYSGTVVGLHMPAAHTELTRAECTLQGDPTLPLAVLTRHL
jgi:hypothetical protein